MICESKEFTALKLKDRMTQGKETSSGWRDAMINGRFDDVDTHVVEIQLHHKKLVSIREDLGGHFLYSIYRSIIEALEVVFGEKRTQEMIEEYAAPKVNNGEQSGEIIMLRTENCRLASENKELKCDISRLDTDNNKLTTDNSKLTSDNSKLTSDNSKLTSDNSKLTSDNSKLTSDNSKLTSDNSKLTSDNSRLNTHNSKLTSENKELKNEIDNLKKQMHEQQGSSSSPAPSNDQWHVVLLNWFREFTDESKHAKRFEPRYPKSKEDLLALTKIDLSGCNLKGPIPKELGQLQKLTHLWLNENQLTGTEQFEDSMKKELPGCSVSV
jgi:predicted RNase H-like nuclease (RuvC/YqgF family)